jgi:hypothetical protein
MKATFLVGMIGFILSLMVLGISVLLPIVNGPRTSWREAAWGIIPGAGCSFVFLVVMLIGLFLMLNAAVSKPSEPRRRLEEDDEYPEEEPKRTRSREWKARRRREDD